MSVFLLSGGSGGVNARTFCPAWLGASLTNKHQTYKPSMLSADCLMFCSALSPLWCRSVLKCCMALVCNRFYLDSYYRTANSRVL